MLVTHTRTHTIILLIELAIFLMYPSKTYINFFNINFWGTKLTHQNNICPPTSNNEFNQLSSKRVVKCKL